KPLDLGGENIAAAAHRLNHRRDFGVVSEPAPKPAELYVDRPNERPSLAMAGEIEQLGSAQHLMGLLTNAASRLNAPVVSGTSLPDGEISFRLARLKAQSANRAFDGDGICFSVVWVGGRRSTLLTVASRWRLWYGFGT